MSCSRSLQWLGSCVLLLINLAAANVCTFASYSLEINLVCRHIRHQVHRMHKHLSRPYLVSNYPMETAAIYATSVHWRTSISVDPPICYPFHFSSLVIFCFFMYLMGFGWAKDFFVICLLWYDQRVQQSQNSGLYYRELHGSTIICCWF